jgi:hypothetical protein
MADNLMEPQEPQEPQDSKDTDERPETDVDSVFDDLVGEEGPATNEGMEEIPNFYVPDTDAVFPAGLYICALGGLRSVRGKEDKSKVIAVLNDVWIIKYHGTEDSPADQLRISIKDGMVDMSERGAKMVERYPNPAEMPSMAWKSRAFFSHFDALVEDPKTKEKYVDWSRVAAQKGRVFQVSVVYNKSKGKNYRNLEYDTLQLDSRKIAPADMQKIENHYADMMRERNKSKSDSTNTPDTKIDDDLPF